MCRLRCRCDGSARTSSHAVAHYKPCAEATRSCSPRTWPFSAASSSTKSRTITTSHSQPMIVSWFVINQQTYLIWIWGILSSCWISGMIIRRRLRMYWQRRLMIGILGSSITRYMMRGISWMRGFGIIGLISRQANSIVLSIRCCLRVWMYRSRGCHSPSSLK